MPASIQSLETPVPVIDLAVVERNLAAMQAYCTGHGLALRPHIKTHKLPQFAHRQLAMGAGGITCQKLGEAEVMVAAGIEDILISYPLIGAAKALRLAALARRAQLRVAADNPLAIATAAQARQAAQAELGVLVEFDSGGQRTGVTTVDAALALARQAQEAGLRFDGLMTYPSSAATAQFVAAARPAFAAAGLGIAVVSGGGTPAARHAHALGVLTELRVGTYIYHDRSTVALGAATLADCALLVHATVVSRPTPARAVIDAGSKTLSSDLAPPQAGPGYGLLAAYPEAVITRLNEEHGIVDLTACARRPVVGEVVQIVPNHVCVVSNLHDEVVVTRDGQVVGTWPVAARGRSR